MHFDHKKRLTLPVSVLFEGQEYPIVKLGFHHTYREGRVLYHVFSVAGSTIFFRLVLNTETLGWLLTEVHDGEVN